MVIINTITMARHAAELEGLIRHDRACRAPRVLLTVETLSSGRLAAAAALLAAASVGATLATAASGVKVFVTTHVRHAGDSSGEWYGPKYELWPADESTYPSFHFPLSSVSRAKQFAAFELQLHLYDKDADDAADVPESFWLGGSLRVSVAECGSRPRTRRATRARRRARVRRRGRVPDAGGALPPGRGGDARRDRRVPGKRCADRGQHRDAIRVYSVDVLDALAYGVDATVDFPPSSRMRRAAARSTRSPSFHFVDERYSTLQLATSYVGLLLTRSSPCTPRGRVRRAPPRARPPAAALSPRPSRAPSATRPSSRAGSPVVAAAAACDDLFCWFVVRGAWALGCAAHRAARGALGAILFVPCLIDELRGRARRRRGRGRGRRRARSARARAGRGRDDERGPSRGAGPIAKRRSPHARARRGRRIIDVDCARPNRRTMRGPRASRRRRARARAPRRARRVLFRVRRAARRAARARVSQRASRRRPPRCCCSQRRRRGRARRGRDRGRAIPVALARLELPLVASPSTASRSVPQPPARRELAAPRRRAVLAMLRGGAAVRAAAAAVGSPSSCCSTDLRHRNEPPRYTGVLCPEPGFKFI